jgi:large subunit ribosomal protein L28
MSRICPVTGKHPVSGNKRSHSLIATRRRWDVNLQNYTLEDKDGNKFQVRLSARGRRTMNKSLKAQ